MFASMSGWKSCKGGNRLSTGTVKEHDYSSYLGSLIIKVLNTFESLYASIIVNETLEFV